MPIQFKNEKKASYHSGSRSRPNPGNAYSQELGPDITLERTETKLSNSKKYRACGSAAIVKADGL